MKVDLFFKKLSENFINLVQNSDFMDQYPLSIISIDKKINNENILKAMDNLINKDLKQYSPLFLSNVVLLLLNHEVHFNNKQKLFKKIIDILTTHYFKKKIDILHPDSLSFIPFDLNFLLKKSNYRYSDLKEYRKMVFLLDNILDLVSPIYKGWGFSIFEKDNKLIRIYFDLENYYVLVGNLRKNPNIDIFGHIIEPELVESYSVYLFKNNKFKLMMSEDLLVYLKEKINQLILLAPKTNDSLSIKYNYVLKQWTNIFGVKYKFIEFDENDFISNPSPLKLNEKDIPIIKENMVNYYNQLYYEKDKAQY